MQIISAIFQASEITVGFGKVSSISILFPTLFSQMGHFHAPEVVCPFGLSLSLGAPLQGGVD